MPTVLEGVGRLVKIIFGLVGSVVLVCIVGAASLYYYYTRDLPHLSKLADYHPDVVSQVFDDHETKIGEFWQESRYYLPYKTIPPLAIKAFVASEDSRFWEHEGVDFLGILRATFENLRAGRVVQGGSTITQQITRSILLSPTRTFDRKIKEAILATQIEQNLSKEQILELYLNQIYLGNRSYGIESAARNYFHKGIKDLNLSEMAMIAGLPSAPNSFSPLANVQAAKKRQEIVLSRMLDNGYIGKKDAVQAFKEPLKVYRAGIDKDFNNLYAPYFVEYIRKYIEEKYGDYVLYHEGLKIYTTANLEANRAADRAVKRGLHELDRRKGFRGPLVTVREDEINKFAEMVHQEVIQASLQDSVNIPQLEGRETTPLELGQPYKGIVLNLLPKGDAEILVGRVHGTISNAEKAWTGHPLQRGEVYWVTKKDETYFNLVQEPKLESALFSYNPLTGAVKAMIGGYSFKKSEFNRATQALRQPGSAFKPIVYSAALDKGYSPKTIIVDGPVSFTVGREIWSPKNYGNKFSGPMSLRSAITNSVNVVAVKIFHDIGIDYAVAFARKLGLTTPVQKYLSSALGASDVILQDLARAYGTFPNGGKRPKFIYISKIVDQNGRVLEEHPIPEEPENPFASEPSASKGEYNEHLMKQGDEETKKDRLKLTHDDLKVLYGSAIPEDHVITPKTAYLMVSLMKSVVDHGTGFKAKELGRPAAGKTGTTNDESDAWFVGYVPNMVTGVWLGYDSRKPIGPKMTGGVVSAPIWLYYMQEVMKDQPIRDFAVPPDLKVADLDSMTGGSAPGPREPPKGEGAGYGTASSSRGVDFLYEDF